MSRGNCKMGMADALGTARLVFAVRGMQERVGPPGTSWDRCARGGGDTSPWWGRAGGEDHGGFLAVATTCVSHLGDGTGAVLGSCSRSSGSRRDSKDEALLPLGSAGS